MQAASYRRSVGYEQIYKPQATDYGLLLPPPVGEVAAGQRGIVCQVVGGRVWEAGK